MLTTIIGNTIAVLLVVLLVGAALRSIIKSHKNGGCSCGGGCAGCSGNCAGCTHCAHAPQGGPVKKK